MTPDRGRHINKIFCKINSNSEFVIVVKVINSSLFRKSPAIIIIGEK